MSSLTEESDPLCMPTAVAQGLLADAPWRRFAVIGDSLSAGTGDARPGYGDQPWCDRVADVLRRLNPELAYHNTAVIRATTAQTLETQIEPMLAFAPDLLHLPCGGNDVLRREPDFAEIEQTMRRMYDAAARTAAQLTTFTIGRAYVVPVFPDWTERILRLNDITRTLAAEYGAAVVDMYDHPVNAREDLLSEDGVHFAAPGQAVMKAEVVKTLARVLGRAE